MKPAPRELRMPDDYTLEYGNTGEGPVKLTLTDMPFWDISALLSAVRFEVTVPPAEGGEEVKSRREYRYRLEGVTDAQHGKDELSFLFDRTIHPNVMLSRVKEAYMTTLTETYAQRARSEARIRPSLPRPLEQNAAALVIARVMTSEKDYIEQITPPAAITS